MNWKLFLSLTLLLSSCGGDIKDENTINEITILKEKVDALKHEAESLKLENEKLKKEKGYWYDIEYDGFYLIQQGIHDPSSFVDSSLRSRLELIPLDAVLGGTMHYGKIKLLSHKWVVADYDDGHIQGRSFYEYKLKRNGELEFMLIRSLKNQ